MNIMISLIHQITKKYIELHLIILFVNPNFFQNKGFKNRLRGLI